MTWHRIVATNPARKRFDVRLVVDLETWGLDATKLAVGVIGDVDTGVRRIFHSKEGYRLLLEEMRGDNTVVYAHNGWRFDYLGLYDILEIKNAKKIDKRGRIILAIIDEVELRDFVALVPLSLSQLGGKGETPLKFLKGLEEEGVNDEDIAYCIQDCDVLATAIRELETLFAEWCGVAGGSIDLPLTAASMAYRVWCATAWPSHWRNPKGLGIAFCDERFNDALDAAYSGGRTQLLCSPAVLHTDVVALDRNAMFPAEMRDREFPDMSTCREVLHSERNLRTLLASNEVCMWADIDLCGGPPFLPNRDASGRRCWDRSAFSGWLCGPEIAHALDIGYEVEEIREIHYATAIHPFRAYVDKFYTMRREMLRQGDPRQIFVKLLLVSLYGKFGMRDIHERLESDEDIHEALSSGKADQYTIGFYDGPLGELMYLESIEISRKASCQWFGFCAFTTSYARVSLNRAILAAGDDALYCDTDSLFLKQRSVPALLEEVVIGDGLGEWSWDVEEPADFVAWEPKAYVWMRDGEKFIVKHKGVTLRDSEGKLLPDAGDLTKDQQMRSVVLPRTAMRRGLRVGSGITTVKRSKRHHGKESPL